MAFASGETSKTVTFRATDDSVDESDETVTLDFGTLPTRVTAGSTSQTAVTITDNDTRGITLSATGLSVNENASDTYTVALSSQPTANVTVTVGGAAGDVTVDTNTDMANDQATLTFTPTNWSTAQTVTVKAADDDDAVTDTAVTLTHTASGGDYASLPSERAPSVTVTITENDTRGVTISETALTVKEGTSGTYTVKLASQPTANVTVTVGGAADDVSVDTDTGTTGNQNTLTFTSSNWSTAQTVTVAAATDEDAANDAVVTLTHAVAGGDYGSVTAASVAVTITEKDAATFSVTGPATIAEGAGKATYTVSLSAEPGADVTVKYATSDGTTTAGSDYTAASGTLTFTTTNWDTNQTVDVAITDDTVDDDDETFTFTLSAPGTGTSLSATSSVTTTITDNDVPAVTVAFGAATYSVTEGSTVSVAVTLSADPERSVTIPLSTTNGTGAVAGDYSGVPASVSFASGETSKTVTFSATDDSVDESDETVTLDFGTLPARVTAGSTSQTVVTITDNDTRGITLSATDLSVNENASDTYTVALSSQPTANVTVTVGGAAGDVTVDTNTDMANDQATLTFTPTSWSTAQTVTVKAADDDDAVTDTAVTLTHTASGGDYASLPSERAPSVTVTITENDTRGVTLSETALTVKEGTSGTYTVKLASQPTANVTVTVGGAADDVSVDTDTGTTGNQNTLTFTTADWKTAQTVTVAAATDEDAANDAVVTLTHAVAGGDYGSVTAASVAVTITEKDAATFSVAGPATIAEGAGKATYTVSLSAEPGADVTVKYATSDGTTTAGSDYTAASGTLTFTTTNWDTNQTVDVAITDDTVDDDDETFTFTLSEPGTGTSLSATSSVTTTITDNDVPAVTVAFGAATYSVTEGSTVSVAVTLSADPERSVTIPLMATNGTGAVAGDYSGVPASVSFASGETSKTVTFSATDDSVDESDETVTLDFGTLPARVTAGSTSQTVVTITDNDTRGITLSATDLSVNENASDTYTVALSSQPTANVTVTVGGAAGDVTVDTNTDMANDQATLTFTPTSWSTAQTVTVKAADDDDAVTDTAVTLTHTASGGDYASLPSERAPSVTVTITENDTRGVTLSETALTVLEGTSGTYTVKLASQPTANVTVTVGGAADDVSVDTDTGTTGNQNTLTFTSSSWSTAQTVTVAAATDEDAANDAVVTLTHAVAGGDYGSVTAGSVAVTITEKDMATFSVAGPAHHSRGCGQGHLHGIAERRARRGRDGEVRDFGRHGDGGFGLHGGERHAHLHTGQLGYGADGGCRHHGRYGG